MRRLFAASSAVREEICRSFVLHFPEKEVSDRGEARARSALEPIAFTTATDAGRALTRQQTLAEAMALINEISADHD